MATTARAGRFGRTGCCPMPRANHPRVSPEYAKLPPPQRARSCSSGSAAACSHLRRCHCPTGRRHCFPMPRVCHPTATPQCEIPPPQPPARSRSFELAAVYLVSGRKLVFSEIAGNGGRLIQGMDGGFCGCSRPNNSNSPAPPTPPLSDLTRGFVGGGFQAARRTGSDRARSRASSSRPITCRL